MKLWPTFLGLLRRPIFTIPVLVLAVAAGVLTYRQVPVRYQVSATMILTAPTSGGSQKAETGAEDDGDTSYNPLLQFNESLQTTAALLILAANTEDVKAGVGAPLNGDTRLQVDDGRSNADLLAATQTGPFIYITAESPTAAKAEAVVTAVREYIRGDLKRLQESLKAPGSTYISVSNVSTDPLKTVQKTRLVATAGAPAAVIVAAFLLAYPFVRRAQRRHAMSVGWRAPAGYAVPAQRTLPGEAEPVTADRAVPPGPAPALDAADTADGSAEGTGPGAEPDPEDDPDDADELSVPQAPDGREDTVVFGAIRFDDEPADARHDDEIRRLA
ncbi:hypothetical protein EDD29_0223 [Actinocorallia herbida]|uniref:Capsular polysaccharide biosynthesis protein n=1 Tax=Actinocorallia herbida TaxID=58109 RepID=A0A3N1CN46_9ACTN|nr:hypothetical protein [Actinocorallia herbida]ROO82740.1 hypothetical protein EDD29_0223 [Actinocorallia herbida]